MNMKKLLASLTAGSLCLGAAAVLPKSTSAADTQYRIMCVGDSITHGYINGDNGYRKYLCYYLQQNGISYDMVGPENGWTDAATYNWNGTTITYDPQHCGYSGYSTMSYSGRTGIYETLFGGSNLMETYDPDMVLLQIGTNDLLDASLDIRTGVGDIRETTTALDRLETVVDKILENMDSTDVLFVTTVPDIDANTCASWVSSYQWTFGITAEEIPAKVQECVDSYNAGVKALVAEKQAAGKNVQLGDINSVVDYTAGDLEDGCHPSEQGYAKMGAHWAEQITAYLGGETTPPATEETTESTTESDVAETETTPSETTAEPTETTTETTEPVTETTEPTTDPTEPTTTETTTTETTAAEPETTETTTETTVTETTEEESDPSDEVLLGDVNVDEKLNILDILTLQKYLLGSGSLSRQGYPLADMNQDGKVNAFDLAMLKKAVLKANSPSTGFPV